jgi:two-component system, cell cycle sensor histidine kinase and response regulator CckA
VLRARSAEEGVALSRRQPGRIDLLLTDVVMPGVSGTELARRLAQDRPNLVTLFMSGYTDDTIAAAGPISPGLLLEKPFSADTLAAKVAEVLDTRRA